MRNLHRKAPSGALVLVCLYLALGAEALPIVEVDVDASLAGRQDQTTVTAATSFEVAILISQVDPSAPLNAFELDLDFDGLVLTPLSVRDGGFMLDPVLVVQEELDALRVSFAEVTLGAAGATGDGVLAIVEFQGVGLGTSNLELSDVLLSAPFGVEIPTATVASGSVFVVPEPAAASLVAMGLLLLAGSRKSRTRR